MAVSWLSPSAPRMTFIVPLARTGWGFFSLVMFVVVGREPVVDPIPPVKAYVVQPEWIRRIFTDQIEVHLDKSVDVRRVVCRLIVSIEGRLRSDSYLPLSVPKTIGLPPERAAYSHCASVGRSIGTLLCFAKPLAVVCRHLPRYARTGLPELLRARSALSCGHDGFACCRCIDVECRHK
jgi:hypothetical protein